MANTRKQYGPADEYERKLLRVMARLGVAEEHVNWNFDRWGCWVEFRYRGELYRFDHSIEKAQTHGVALRYGSDVFAQVVLALEDLARIVERGIYDLATWVSGMKFLPAPALVPQCLKDLGFAEIPATVQDVRTRYRELAKTLHPDAGGSAPDFQKLKQASEQAIKFMEARKGGGHDAQA